MRFKELAVGDTFDFIAPTGYNSFFVRCTKVSARKYRYENGHPAPFNFYVAQVGAVNCEVYHVTKETK